jgi:hypothetical protein
LSQLEKRIEQLENRKIEYLRQAKENQKLKEQNVHYEKVIENLVRRDLKEHREQREKDVTLTLDTVERNMPKGNERVVSYIPTNSPNMPKEERDCSKTYDNRHGNRGNFVGGYMNPRGTEPAEFDAQELKERKEFKKRWAVLRRQSRRSTNMLFSGFYNLFTLEHPFRAPLQIVAGIGGIANNTLETLVRVPVYGITRCDGLDRKVHDFFDASWFGDSYMRLHSRHFFEQFGEHPVKGAISITEDVLPFVHCRHGKGGETGATAGNPLDRSGGRGGGAGTP